MVAVFEDVEIVKLGSQSTETAVEFDRVGIFFTHLLDQPHISLIYEHPRLHRDQFKSPQLCRVP